MQNFTFCVKCTKIQLNDILKTVSVFNPLRPTVAIWVQL